ncbi:MAG: hypothetical protein WA715_15730 [Candidatus Acidiferrum sp.]
MSQAAHKVQLTPLISFLSLQIFVNSEFSPSEFNVLELHVATAFTFIREPVLLRHRMADLPWA